MLDGDVTRAERRFETILNLISEVGGIFKGLTILFGVLLYSWQSYKHDQNLAQALLLEKTATKDTSSSELS